MRRPRPNRLAAGIVAAGLGLATIPRPAQAMNLNGFLPAAGEGAVAVSLTAESYDEFWMGETRVSAPPLGEVETTSTALWGRWGFTDRWSVVANLPWIEVDTDGFAGLSDEGLGDAEAMLLWRAVETTGVFRHRLVLGAGLRVPASDYEADAPISLGDGTTDGLFRVVYQIERGSFYASQQIGYDLRGEEAPDGFPLFTEVGYTYGRLTASAFLAILRADGGTDIGEPGFTFPSNREESTRTGAKIYARFTDAFGAALSGFTTLDGRNTGDSSGVSLGAVVNF